MALTIAEMTSEISRLGTLTERATERYSAAEKSYQSQTDPATYGSETLAQAAATEYLPYLQQAESDALRNAEIAQQGVRAILAELGSDEPSLTPEEEQRAAARLTVIKEDCEQLPIPELLSRARTAVQSNDRAAMFLYARYGLQRLKASPYQDQEDDHVTRAKGELNRLLREAQGALTGAQFAAVRKQGIEVLNQASTLKTRASRRRASTQRYAFQGANDVRWPGDRSQG